MIDNFRRFVFSIRDTFPLYAGISVVVFLFILFFQPFPNQFADLNNSLVFNAGFGAIIFILLFAIHAGIELFKQYDEEALSYLNGLVLLILSATAFTFYLRYVGHGSITFYIAVKIILICLAPPIMLIINRLIRKFKQEHDFLLKEITSLRMKLSDQVSTDKPVTIDLPSTDNLSPTVKLNVPDILLIKSADNYVEIHYKDTNSVKKSLVRTTLRNIELLLNPYPSFIRCHRTCIVNKNHIEKVHLKINSSYILLKNLNEHIPVSRLHVIKLKEAMNAKQG